MECTKRLRHGLGREDFEAINLVMIYDSSGETEQLTSQINSIPLC